MGKKRNQKSKNQEMEVANAKTIAELKKSKNPPEGADDKTTNALKEILMNAQKKGDGLNSQDMISELMSKIMNLDLGQESEEPPLDKEKLFGECDELITCIDQRIEGKFYEYKNFFAQNAKPQ